jgi:molybdate transport system substrate-binding protein
MGGKHRGNIAVRCVCLVILAGACDRGGSSGGPSGTTTRPATAGVTALVAASTADAVNELAERFQRQTGAAVKVSPGPSNQLAAQITQGAPADVFLSANAKWADEVKNKGLAADSRDLLSNGLVIVVPKGNPADVHSPEDLAKETVKKVALAGENVPAGLYAAQALAKLNLLPRLVAGNKIARGQDVRATLTYVERGEAEAGVVYTTDAAVSKLVETAYTFDPATYERIVYPLVLLKVAEAPPAARQFYQFLASAEAEDVFRRHGFIVIR